MPRILHAKPKAKRLQYNRENLERAFNATTSGMSVYKAAREYNVPESTLRDRTRGNIDLNAQVGFKTIFSRDEEKKLVDHITYMASIGYGYNKSGIQFMARDYAVSLGKTLKSKEALSNCWFYGFMSRWENLKLVKPQKLATCRAKAASKENIDNYFKELSTIFTKNDLNNKPEKIFNIDETGVNCEHSPPKVVCDNQTNAQAITSQRSSTTTVIAGGSAVGTYIPPYYIFEGKRWNPELLSGAAVGSDGEMSKSGWSNTAIFKNYLTKHFVKHTGIREGASEPPTLILYDGHKSHINLTLKEWAKKRNIILFVLPPHTSHITQPLDVSVFGPFKSMYNRECQTYLRNNPGINITKHKIAELTAKPYTKALCPDNLVSGFKKPGIYPLNKSVITDSQLAPAMIYPSEDMQLKNTEISNSEPDNSLGNDAEDEGIIVHMNVAEVGHDIPDGNENMIKEVPVQFNERGEMIPEKEIDIGERTTECSDNVGNDTFFERRTITNVIEKRKRKFKPPFLAGNLEKASNVSIMKKTQEKANNKIEKSKTTDVSKTKKPRISRKQISKKCTKRIKTENQSVGPKPGTSGLNKDRGGPISLISDNEMSDFMDDDDDGELCCVCYQHRPLGRGTCDFITITNWGKCNNCDHYVHLKYCTDVRVIRCGDKFLCPHCA